MKAMLSHNVARWHLCTLIVCSKIKKKSAVATLAIDMECSYEGSQDIMQYNYIADSTSACTVSNLIWVTCL